MTPGEIILSEEMQELRRDAWTGALCMHVAAEVLRADAILDEEDPMKLLKPFSPRVNWDEANFLNTTVTFQVDGYTCTYVLRDCLKAVNTPNATDFEVTRD